MAVKSAHSRLFEELIVEYRAKLVNSVTGFINPQYAEIVGEIRGLDNALALSMQADAKLSGEQ